MYEKSKQDYIKILFFITLQLAIVLLSAAVGYFGFRHIGQYREELGVLKQARDIMVRNTIHAVPEDRILEYGMIRGMLNTLEDPYTHFVEPAAHEVQTDQLTGTYGGIGLNLERDLQLNWRVYPLPDSPASEAGIQDGDRLVKVDELYVTAETNEITLTAAIRGPVGDRVRIIVLREGQELSFTIRREIYTLPSASWHLLPDEPLIGLVKVYRIAGTTASEIQEGIEDLLQRGASGVVLDLRDNGGGLVEAGVEIANLFLSDVDILHRQFRDQDTDIFSASTESPFESMPLVILINGNTASSAEIIAGALQQHQRATLIGAETHGKTTIQLIFELQDGSSIHITGGRWWIPGQTFPLKPDFPIQDDPDGVVLIQTAMDVLMNEIDQAE